MNLAKRKHKMKILEMQNHKFLKCLKMSSGIELHDSLLLNRNGFRTDNAAKCEIHFISSSILKNKLLLFRFKINFYKIFLK